MRLVKRLYKPSVKSNVDNDLVDLGHVPWSSLSMTGGAPGHGRALLTFRLPFAGLLLAPL
jgi:hypothetical protein